MPTTFDAEMSLVGAIMIDPDSYGRVSEIVTADSFHLETTQRIFIAAGELKADGTNIDPLTLKQKFSEHGWPIDNETLFQYMNITPTAANDVEYAKVVRDQYIRRKLRDMSMRIIDDDISNASDLLADAYSETLRLTQTETSGRLASSYEMASTFVRDIEDRDKGKQAYVPTGFPTLDTMLGGGMPVGGMIVIAARPGMGKTSLALNIADNIDGPVLFVSLEMTVEQITAKRMAMRCGIPSHRLLMGHGYSEHEYEVMAEASTSLSKSQVMINRRLEATISDINIMARSIKGLKCVIIDYLGLIRTKTRGSLYERTTEISGSLKRLALSLNIPVVALAQLNRQSEGTQDKRPTLANLRDSGAIEQDADVVMLLYRENYYEGDQQEEECTIEVNVAKNRHGQTGKMQMAAQLGKNRFFEFT